MSEWTFLPQNCSQWPPAEKIGRGSLLNDPSCPSGDPISQGTDVHWTQKFQFKLDMVYLSGTTACEAWWKTAFVLCIINTSDLGPWWKTPQGCFILKQFSTFTSNTVVRNECSKTEAHRNTRVLFQEQTLWTRYTFKYSGWKYSLWTWD